MEDSPLTGSDSNELAVLIVAGGGGDGRSRVRVISTARPSTPPSACTSVDELWVELKVVLTAKSYHTT